jgi:WGR domain
MPQPSYRPVELRRIDPARNMHRFYRLAIEPDRFGGGRLLRQWAGWIMAARPKKDISHAG